MVSTATPAVRANCSIRYSMSTYSNNRRRAGRPCLPRRVPVVHAVKPVRVRAVGAGEELHRVAEVLGGVVVKVGLGHFAPGPLARGEASGVQDRAWWVM